MEENKKIFSSDIEPRHGYHYLLINGVEAGRFDSIKKALAARETILQPDNIRQVEREQISENL